MTGCHFSRTESSDNCRSIRGRTGVPRWRHGRGGMIAISHMEFAAGPAMQGRDKQTAGKHRRILQVASLPQDRYSRRCGGLSRARPESVYTCWLSHRCTGRSRGSRRAPPTTWTRRFPTSGPRSHSSSVLGHFAFRFMNSETTCEALTRLTCGPSKDGPAEEIRPDPTTRWDRNQILSVATTYHTAARSIVHRHTDDVTKQV